MKKILSLILALVATTTLWAYDFQSGDLYYNITSDTTVEVTNKSSSYPYNEGVTFTTATIPKTVTYNGTTYSVTSISSYAFYDCSSLTSVTIPNSVTSIGDEAFAWCFDLTSITIPNSVTSIGEFAFYNCSSLTSIKIEATTPPALGSNAFPSNPTAIYIPDNTLSTYQQAWGNEYTYINNESVLTLHIEVPGTLSDLIFDAGMRPANIAKLTLTGTLNDDDFTCMRETMTSLADVDLSGITNTSGVNFENKSGLKRIILPNNLTSIGDWAFAWCFDLTSITIPNSVTSIGSNAFYSCSSLTSITIPNSVTSIGDEAFSKCTFLTSITIPNSVTSIGNNVFYDCSFLTSITVEKGNSIYDSRENCNAVIETATNTLIAGCQNTIIPNNVTSIGDEAFAWCFALTSITIPNSVTSIGDGAFAWCFDLTSITIPNSVTSIGSNAFYSCSSLPVENNLRYADTYLVEAVDKTLSIYSIKEGTKWIGDNAFSDCYSLTSITIPNSVTSIGHMAFSGCSSLTSITIPNSVTSIGDDAFRNCSSLTSVTIPNSVTSIGYSAFGDCSSLTSITIPNSVTSIGYSAFGDCSSLTSIAIPSSVTSIGDRAFSGCSSLTSITVEKGNSIYDSRENCNAVIETATNTLIAGCQNTIIPNSVTSIGDDAFRNCSSLTSITIPNSVTSIGNTAFYSCSSLTTVICKAIGVPELGLGVFKYMHLSESTLYVPAQSLENYKSADQWKDFGTILPIHESPTNIEHTPLGEIGNQSKFLRNGQVYILQDGNTYTIMGQKL